MPARPLQRKTRSSGAASKRRMATPDRRSVAMSNAVSNPTLNDERWAAVAGRDAAQDGRFVYAVATTGVYCKPTCASRRPLRRNVRFFATPAEAELAGFRACKRCRPSSEASNVITGVVHEL